MNNIKTLFKGRTFSVEACNFVQDKVLEGYRLEGVTQIANGCQVSMVKPVEAEPADVSQLMETLDAMEDTSNTDTVEPEPEVVEEDSIDEVEELVVDWEHVSALESSEELEDYFEPLGFNANPNHKPATIIKKAKVHFGV